MIVPTLLKAVTTLCLSIALTPECRAQAAGWYQQVSPSYYYGYNPSYQYPSYQYQRQTPRKEASAPAPKKSAAKQKTSRKPTSSTTHKPKSASVNTNRWRSDFDGAWAEAVKQGKPLVVIFTHHGCPECQRLDATLAQPAAMNTLSSAIKTRIEFTQNPATVTRFGVKLTPTFLVLSPAHNGEVYREVGALSLDRLNQLKPSIDSLVTAPAKSSAESRPTKTKAEQIDDEGPEPAGEDDATSRTVAAL